jgi:DNA-binding response OmpR family regulator
LKELKVLVVDDAAFVRDLVKKGLRSNFSGVRMFDAHDGRYAQNQLEKGEFDLVLCDWEMPNMSGDELLQWMRGNPKTEKTPFVMITSRGERENVMRAVELKADNYIVKPFTEGKLIEVVSRVLSRSLKVPVQSLRKGASGSRRPGGPLSEGLPIAETITTDKAPGKPAQAKPSQPAAARPAEKVLAQLRFSGDTVRTLVKEVTTERLSGVIRREDKVPEILELAVLDLETGDGRVSRINGYVHTLQAREHRKESEFINIIVEFIDDDEEKLAHLRQYVKELAG